MAHSYSSEFIDSWVLSLLANPVTKLPASPEKFETVDGILDARVYLKNSFGYSGWSAGQDVYESWEASGEGYDNQFQAYKAEIEYDAPVYDQFKISGDVLDVGGGAGTVREFLPKDCRFISIDPFIDAPFKIPKPRLDAYQCLSTKLNFLGAMAEFLPFQASNFDWVHMRSMLDHVHVPDLALLEAHRVLRDDGKLLVGLYIEGGKSGEIPKAKRFKDFLESIGLRKKKDFHTWHPTYVNLVKLIEDNGFKVRDSYWQPHWKDKVVYIQAEKSN